MITQALTILLFSINHACSWSPTNDQNTRFSMIRKSSSSTSQLAATQSKTLEAMFFACDGVLADTERDGHRISFNKAFEENVIDDR